MSSEKRFLVSGTITRTMEVEADTIDEAVKLWQAAAGSGYPDSWEEVLEDGDDPNGQKCGFIVGGCECCGRPILEGQPYNCDTDGIVWHKEGDPACRSEASR